MSTSRREGGEARVRDGYREGRDVSSTKARLDLRPRAGDTGRVSHEPRRSAQVLLRIRTKLTNVSTIYSIPLRKVATALTGKANLAGLYAWCQKEGVGIDGFHLGLIPGGMQGSAWLDARRRNGIFIDRIGNVVATLENGAVKGDAAWEAWLSLLPPTAPAEWGSTPAPASAREAAPVAKSVAKAAPAKPKRKAVALESRAKTPPLSARVDVELTSRAQASKLSAIRYAQLEVASKELCGKKGLAALFRACDAEGRGVAHLTITRGKTARYEAWLGASLEDGIFFDAGATAPNGLAISQADVHATQRAREPEVAALAAAMKKLRAPPAPEWKG